MTLRSAGGGLQELVERDFLVREPRSTIRGEEAYRFKHVLIRDVAYAGLSKSSRALLHRQMARWLAGRPVADELVEIRAYHLDESAELEVELEGRVPADLAAEAAAALEQAGRRALAREANRVARRLLVRAVELEATLERRYLAARAAWRMTDIPDGLDRDARCERGGACSGDSRIEGRALTALAQVALYRDADNDCARELAGRALAVVEETDDVGRFDALEVLGTVCWWEGDLDEVERLATERLAIAERIGRADLAERLCCSSSTTSTTPASSRSARTSRWRGQSSSPARAGARRHAGGRCAPPVGRRRSRAGSPKPRSHSSRRAPCSPRAERL